MNIIVCFSVPFKGSFGLRVLQSRVLVLGLRSGWVVPYQTGSHQIHWLSVLKGSWNSVSVA